ncbi:metal-dependent transcriptional regulator [Candidatus Riflebacteria bacterium]
MQQNAEKENIEKILTPSQENYLEWIFRFSKISPVRPGQLASKLGLKRPSVTRALRLLAEKGLIHHEAYGAIHLTDAGRKVGEEIIRRDNCLTRLLVDVLDMKASEADPAVHQMEHVLSETVLLRLELLVEFILSDPEQIKKLKKKIQTLQTQSIRDVTDFHVGATNVHAGLAREKYSA